MGVTLTGKTIKDTYKGLLKFEDNLAVGVTPKRVTDGFGNDVGIKLSNEEVVITKPYTAMTSASITADVDGKVLVSKEWITNNVGSVSDTYARDFYGDGVLTSFVLENPFGYDNVMVQVVNHDTGVYLSLGTDYTATRAYDVAATPQHSMTIDLTVALGNGVECHMMLAKMYGPVY